MQHPWSIARRLAAAQLLGLLVLTVFAGWASFVQTRDTVHRLEGERVMSAAQLLAQEYEVVVAYGHEDPSAELQPLALDAAERAEVSWVTFLTPDGTRLSHWMPDWVGTRYTGTLSPATEGTAFAETSTTGEAGPSVRALVPVRALPDDGPAGSQPGAEFPAHRLQDLDDGPIVGVVAVGQRVTQLDILARSHIPALLAVAGVVAAAGLLFNWLLHRYLTRTTLGLGPEQMAERFTFLDTALHNVAEGMLLISPRGHLRLYNDRAAELLGLPPFGTGADGEPGTLHLRNLSLPTPLGTLLQSGRAAQDELFTAGDRILVVNQHPTRVDRSRSPLQWLRSGQAGPDQGTVVTLYDHTDVQEMNRELASTRSLTDALRSQTHEHANRLHTVLSMLELGRVEEAQRLLMESVGQGGHADDRALESGAEPALVALLMAKSAQARERGVSLDHRMTVDVPTGIPAADLVTVLGNLVDNALDAVSEPGVDPEDRWVEVEARLEEGWLVLEVADGGPGPSPEDRDRVFELGWSTKPAGPDGRGVGLALVRQTAHRLGGHVELAVDSGTVFTVEIPVRHGALLGRSAADEAGETRGDGHA